MKGLGLNRRVLLESFGVICLSLFVPRLGCVAQDMGSQCEPGVIQRSVHFHKFHLLTLTKM